MMAGQIKESIFIFLKNKLYGQHWQLVGKKEAPQISVYGAFSCLK